MDFQQGVPLEIPTQANVAVAVLPKDHSQDSFATKQDWRYNA